MKACFSTAKGAVVAEYAGLTVADLTTMRVQFRKVGVDFRVAKNTLARRASEGTASAVLKDAFVGQVGVAVGYDDPVVLAKTVMDYAKTKADKFTVKAAMIEGKLCTAEQLKAVASLPSREILLSQMAGAFQAPAQKLAALMANTVTRFAFALEALKAKKAA